MRWEGSIPDIVRGAVSQRCPGGGNRNCSSTVASATMRAMSRAHVRARFASVTVAVGVAVGCVPPRDPPPRPAPSVAVDAAVTSVITRAPAPIGGCPALSPTRLTNPGTVHSDTVRGRERWRASASPHRVPYGTHLLAGATLELEPCVLVVMGPRAEFVVQDRARLVAVGRSDAPIRFTSGADTPRAGDWRGLELRAHLDAETRLEHVTVEHAGAEPPVRGESPAAIRVWAVDGADLRDVTVRSYVHWGVALSGRGRLAATSRDLTVTAGEGEGTFTVADVEAVESIPSGRYTGNAHDDIRVEGRQRRIARSTTWRALGPRYQLRSPLHIEVGGDARPVWTLAPGVELALAAEVEIDVGYDAPGALVADGGSPETPVIFRASDPSPGAPSWTGIFFGPRAEVSASRVRHARIEGAGAPSGSVFRLCPPTHRAVTLDAAMVVFDGVDPGESITDTAFVAGPRNGFAVLRSGDFPTAPSLVTDTSHRNDLTRADVAVAESSPLVRGSCGNSR